MTWPTRTLRFGNLRSNRPVAEYEGWRGRAACEWWELDCMIDAAEYALEAALAGDQLNDSWFGGVAGVEL